MTQHICIAGKSLLAVSAMRYLNKYIKGKDINLLACITKTDDGENGWQPSYVLYCKKNNVEVVELTKCYEIDNLIFISLQFDRIIDPSKFSSTKLYNIHFSKLPAYKGVFTSIIPLLNGETETGVTLHYIDKGIDTGEIINQRCFMLAPDINSSEVYRKYQEEGLILFENQIQSIIANQVVSHPQNAVGSSYYSKSSLNFSPIIIDLNKTAFEIHNQVRAFCFREYQLPVIYGHTIYKSQIIDNTAKGKAGTIICEDEWILLINAIDYRVKLYIDKLDVLINSACKGDLLTYQSLLENNFPVNTRTKEGWDALIIACYNNQTGFVKRLLDDGWNINSHNYKGTTVAMYAMTAASKYNDLSVLKTISPFSPNWEALDDRNKNIFEYSLEYGNEDVISYLKGMSKRQ